jgi:hypothetical protein
MLIEDRCDSDADGPSANCHALAIEPSPNLRADVMSFV